MNEFLKTLDELYANIQNGVDVANSSRKLMTAVYNFGLKRYNEKQMAEAKKAEEEAKKAEEKKPAEKKD